MENLIYISIFGTDVTRSIKIILFRMLQIELQITQMTATHISLGLRFLKWEFDPTFRFYKGWLIQVPKES